MSNFLRAAATVLAVAAAGAGAAPAPRYSITEIAVPGATWIEVNAVNNRGDVAGFARGPHPGVTFEVEQAFLWSNGTATNLGFPGGVLNSRIWGMNDKGLLVGGVLGGNAYTWQDGTWTDLGVRGEARSVNKSGAIAGIARDGFARGFFYNNGVLWDIGMPTYYFASSALSVNDKNVVVGSMEVDSAGNMHGYVWSGGTLTDVGTLGGPGSVLTGINNHAYAVGWSFDRDFGLAAAQYDGDLSRLFNLPGTHRATAVNDRGASVGTIDSGAFLYDGGVMTRLDLLPDVVDGGWTGLVPAAISDRGWIAGRGLRNGLPRGFVLKPR